MSSESSIERRFEEIVEQFLLDDDAGLHPDPHRLIDEHPECAERLREFFAGCDRLDREARPKTPATLAISPMPGKTGSSDRTPTEHLADLATPKLGRFGDYELLEELAHGGMGVVFKARQLSLNRLVAVKMILGGILARADDLQRFRQEAEAVAHLDHPNIVPIYEVGCENGQHYFSMKLVEGGSLAVNMDKVRRDLRAGVAIIAQVARAVDYAHQRGVLHRDLKPGNILLGVVSSQHSADSRKKQTDADYCLLSTDYSPYVTDFGLAKRADFDSNLTQTGAIVGTPSYMAPEQASGGKNIEPAADVWSLGAILYHVLTGRKPFEADTPMGTVMQVQFQDPTRPRAIVPGIPTDLETICLKCLEKSPSRRYGSAAELADDLERWLSNEPIRARPVGVSERLLRRARKHSLVATLLLVLPIAVAATAIIASRPPVSTPDAPPTSTNDQDYVDYVRDVTSALDKMADQRIEAQQILERCLRDLRGWEWHWANRYALTQPRFLKVSDSPIRGVTFSPANDQFGVLYWFAGGNGDPDVGLYDARTMKLLLKIKPTKGSTHSARFSPDGKFILLATGEDELELWDAQSGKLVRKIALKSTCTYASFLHDGKRIAALCAAAPNNVLRLIDAETQKELKVFPAMTGHLQCNQHYLAYWDNGRFSLYDLAKEQSLPWVRGQPTPALHSSLNRAGTRIVSCDRTMLRILELPGFKVLRTVPGKAYDHCGAIYNAAGDRIALTFGQSVRILDAETCEELRVITGEPRQNLRFLAFAPHGNVLLLGCNDGSIGLVDIHESPALGFLEKAQAPRAMAIAPDGRLVATVTSAGVEIRSIAGEKKRVLSTDKPTDIVFHVDGDRLVANESGKGVTVFDAANGRTLNSIALTGKTFMSSDGALAASAEGAQWRVQESLTGNLVQTLGPYEQAVVNVALAAKAQRAAAADNESILLVDLESGKEVKRIAAPAVKSLAFDDLSSRIAYWSQGELCIVDARTGDELLRRAWPKEATSLAFLPNMDRIAVLGNDKCIRIADTRYGESVEIPCLDVPRSLKVSANGNVLGVLVKVDRMEKIMLLDGTPLPKR